MNSLNRTFSFIFGSSKSEKTYENSRKGSETTLFDREANYSLIFEEDYLIEVKFLGFNITNNSVEKYAIYNMQVQLGENSYCIRKRFNQFQELHRIMSKKHPLEYEFNDFP